MNKKTEITPAIRDFARQNWHAHDPGETDSVTFATDKSATKIASGREKVEDIKPNLVLKN